MEEHINDDKVVALGEIGLDYHYDNDVDTKKRQIDAFKKQIELALKHNKPVIIHSRDSIMDTYNVVSSYSNLRGSLHCYSGSLEMAKLFVKRGFLLGVGGVVTFKNAKIVKDVVKNIDLNEVVAGLQIQLLTYLDAACKEEDLMPAGILYFSMLEQMIKADKRISW